MPPGRVLDSRSTAAQGNKEAQFSSAANGPAAHATMTSTQGRTANETDCTTNNPMSLKEACAVYGKGGAVAVFCFEMTSLPARARDGKIQGGDGQSTANALSGIMRVFWGSNVLFKKDG